MSGGELELARLTALYVDELTGSLTDAESRELADLLARHPDFDTASLDAAVVALQAAADPVADELPALLYEQVALDAADFFAVAPDPAARPAAAAPAEPLVLRWLGELALVRRVRALLQSADAPGATSAGGASTAGGEWPKPAYELVWPAGVDERDPDIGRADLPVNLTTILANLDEIRAATGAAGSQLALASFVWLVKDGMVLNPIRHKSILEYLNRGYAPFRYRDLERLAAFENRVFAKYALAHRLAFFDVARLMPRDPDLFLDAIHNTDTGVRVRAWVVLQEMLPLIEKNLASGLWPKADPGAGMPARHPAFVVPPRPLEFVCKAPPA